MSQFQQRSGLSKDTVNRRNISRDRTKEDDNSELSKRQRMTDTELSEVDDNQPISLKVGQSSFSVPEIKQRNLTHPIQREDGLPWKGTEDHKKMRFGTEWMNEQEIRYQLLSKSKDYQFALKITGFYTVKHIEMLFVEEDIRSAVRNYEVQNQQRANSLAISRNLSNAPKVIESQIKDIKALKHSILNEMKTLEKGISQAEIAIQDAIKYGENYKEMSALYYIGEHLISFINTAQSLFANPDPTKVISAENLTKMLNNLSGAFEMTSYLVSVIHKTSKTASEFTKENVKWNKKYDEKTDTWIHGHDTELVAELNMEWDDKKKTWIPIPVTEPIDLSYDYEPDIMEISRITSELNITPNRILLLFATPDTHKEINPTKDDHGLIRDVDSKEAIKTAKRISRHTESRETVYDIVYKTYAELKDGMKSKKLDYPNIRAKFETIFEHLADSLNTGKQNPRKNASLNSLIEELKGFKLEIEKIVADNKDYIESANRIIINELKMRGFITIKDKQVQAFLGDDLSSVNVASLIHLLMAIYVMPAMTYNIQKSTMTNEYPNLREIYLSDKQNQSQVLEETPTTMMKVFLYHLNREFKKRQERIEELDTRRETAESELTRLYTGGLKIRESDIEYSHRVNWPTLPQNSGDIKLIPPVVANMEKAYYFIIQNINALSDITMEQMQVEPCISSLFAELTAHYMKLKKHEVQGATKTMLEHFDNDEHRIISQIYDWVTTRTLQSAGNKKRERSSKNLTADFYSTYSKR